MDGDHILISVDLQIFRVSRRGIQETSQIFIVITSADWIQRVFESLKRGDILAMQLDPILGTQVEKNIIHHYVYIIKKTTC